MTTHTAFIAAILADLGSPLPRLIYADWLEEQGETWLAELQRAVGRGLETVKLTGENVPLLTAHDVQVGIVTSMQRNKQGGMQCEVYMLPIASTARWLQPAILLGSIAYYLQTWEFRSGQEVAEALFQGSAWEQYDFRRMRHMLIVAWEECIPVPYVSRTITYGSSSDAWGSDWTTADVNASDFGATLQIGGQTLPLREWSLHLDSEVDESRYRPREDRTIVAQLDTIAVSPSQLQALRDLDVPTG